MVRYSDRFSLFGVLLQINGGAVIYKSTLHFKLLGGIDTEKQLKSIFAWLSKRKSKDTEPDD
jgi:hypothetical protein